MHRRMHGERDGETENQRERQRGRQIVRDTETDTHAHRQTDSQKITEQSGAGQSKAMQWGGVKQSRAVHRDRAQQRRRHSTVEQSKTKQS